MLEQCSIFIRKFLLTLNFWRVYLASIQLKMLVLLSPLCALFNGFVFSNFLSLFLSGLGETDKNLSKKQREKAMLEKDAFPLKKYFSGGMIGLLAVFCVFTVRKVNNCIYFFLFLLWIQVVVLRNQKVIDWKWDIQFGPQKMLTLTLQSPFRPLALMATKFISMTSERRIPGSNKILMR